MVAGDKVNIDLTFKGLKPGALVPLKDHFTCMYTKPMASTTDVKKMFTNHKFKRELANQEVKKRKLLALFKGHYDNIVEMTPLENDISVRNKVRIVKGKGLVDEEDEKPPAAAAPAPVTPVQLVFREQPCPLSDTDSEKEADSEAEKKKRKGNGNAGLPVKPPPPAAPSAISQLKTAPPAKLGSSDGKK